LQNSLIRFNQI